MPPALPPPPDDLGDLRRRLDALGGELDELRRRLEAFPSGGAGAGMPAGVLERGEGAAAPEEAGDVLPLLGRGVLLLGGAFLVRASTEAGTVSPRVGVACGFAYALAIVLWAQHGGRRGRRREGLADGVAAAAIVFPLIWEAVRRFGVLGGGEAAAGVGVAAHALLAAAAVAGQAALAWVAVVGGVATALAMLSATHDLVPLTVAVLVLAFTTRSLARARGWPGLGWPALAGAAVLVRVGVSVTAGPEAAPSGFGALRAAQVVALALALPVAVLLASAIPRRDRRETPVSGVVQVAFAVAVGYASALRAAPASGLAQGPLAAFGLVGALGAVAWSERRRAARPAHSDASTLVAVAVALYASAHLLGPVGRVVAWSAAGAALCATYRGAALGWAGGALLAWTAVEAGVVTATTRGLLGVPPSHGPVPMALAAAVLAATLVSRRALAARQGTGPLRDGLAALALAPLALFALVAALGAVPDDSAWRNTGVTGVLAGTAVALAALARAGRPFGPPWMAHVALAVGGLKLAVLDLGEGRPATLFVAFALYGAALIVSSQLLRRSAAEAAPPP